MKEIKICFTNPDDVKEFVRAARKLIRNQSKLA